ncbi:WD40 repeat-like protein, partial [Rhizopogon vinicolor AM-OR11-026]
MHNTCRANAFFGLALLQGHTNTVHAIAISFYGQFIANASSDCTVRLWSVRTYQAVSPLFEHADELYCVTFSPDRKHVACGGKYIKVYLSDIQPYTKREADIRGPPDAVTSVCWSRNGEQMFSGCRDGTIRVWSSVSGVQLALLQGHTNTVHAIAISFDGQFIASASSDCTVRLWSVRTYQAVSPPFEHADELYCVTFSPDRKRVACGGKDTKVYLWD